MKNNCKTNNTAFRAIEHNFSGFPGQGNDLESQICHYYIDGTAVHSIIILVGITIVLVGIFTVLIMILVRLLETL